MSNLLFVLGASDPEMATIEQLLVECDVPFAYAEKDESRVHPGNMYSADTVHVPPGVERVVMVECDAPLDADVDVTRCDHHRPGDPGFGLPPERFLEASSIGQVIALLADRGRLRWPADYRRCGQRSPRTPIRRVQFCDRTDRGMWRAPSAGWAVDLGTPLQEAAHIPDRYVLVAAADHCLRDAYAGRCPGVDPSELMRWRAESRAQFQGRSYEEVIADIHAAMELVRMAPQLVLRYLPDDGEMIVVRDMRTPGVDTADCRGPAVPELPEAALRMGEAYIAGPLLTPDGRRKIVVSGDHEVVEAFRDHWGPANGLIDIYAMPERGMGGGYLP